MDVTFMSLPETRVGGWWGWRERCGSWDPEGSQPPLSRIVRRLCPHRPDGGRRLGLFQLELELDEEPALAGRHRDLDVLVGRAVAVRHRPGARRDTDITVGHDHDLARFRLHGSSPCFTGRT